MKIHPILVHFPIAFFFLELLLLVLWTSRKDQDYKRFADFVFRIGYFSMIAAMAAGLFDAGGLAGVKGLVKPHVVAALIVFTVYTARVIFYWMIRKEATQYRWAQIGGAFLGTVAIFYAGYLGGILVYS